MKLPLEPQAPQTQVARTTTNETKEALRKAEASLLEIRSLTNAALAQLSVDELLTFLLDRVLELLHCDTSAALLLDSAGSHLVARAARGIEEEVRQGVRIPVGVGFAGRIAAERRPVALRRVDSSTVTNPILWEKGITSMLGVPLIANGTLVGVLHVGSFSEHVFDDNDIMLLELAADRVASAIQDGVIASERSAAGVLQRSLLPSALPAHASIEFASRYVPAQHGDIGGDWYDAFELPSGDVWVVTGDVVGHGLQSAIIMGRLRSAVRAYALLGMTPEDVLRGANRKLLHFEPDAMATMVCGVFVPPFNEFRMCSAGHPPPVLASPGERPILLTGQPAPPLGVVDDFDAESSRWSVSRGSVLALYTDGLIERRGENLADGLEHIRTATVIDTPERLCSQLMDTLVGSYIPTDDIALLTLRIENEPMPSRTSSESDVDVSIARSELFPCHPTSVREARRFLAECVEQLGLSHLPDAVLMVSELATNAIVHACSEFDVTVEKSPVGSRVEVRDFGGGTPHRAEGDEALDSGRGLRIVDLLASTWGVENRPGGRGKSTWFVIR